MRPTLGNRLITLLLCTLIASPVIAFASTQSFIEVPGVLRPGKYYSFSVDASDAGNASLLLLDPSEQLRYTIYTEYPLTAGINKLGWDGRLIDQGIVEEGEYILRLKMDDSAFIDAPLRIGAPYPMLSLITQSDYALVDDAIHIEFDASETGVLTLQVKHVDDGTVYELGTVKADKGKNSFTWDGTANGTRIPDGECALMLTLRTDNGMESMTEYIYVTLGAPPSQGDSGIITIEDTVAPDEGDPTPAPPLLSPPYSGAGDGTFWSMTPGELDDSVIWDILMQPITVYDDGKIDSKEHVYLMENPDGTGMKVAQIHGTSQGLHVIGATNEHGYVLVEAFSNYDRSYFPETDEERAYAFDMKRGYIKASGLKEIKVQTDMALVIDKLTQRMYLFKDGVRVTEFLISTGIWDSPKDMLFETVPGEFITVSHTGAMPDGNMTSEMAIRINGGILFHEVPHKTNRDGTFDYSSFEAYLGQKKSHGCIRVQRLKTPEGYNQRWLWENFKRGAPYKVIIWDDKNRMDSPSTWQPNPKN